MFPPLSTYIFFLLFRSWPTTFSGFVLFDLFVRPKRALLRYRLIKAQRQMRRLYEKKQYDKVEKWAELSLDLSSKADSHSIRQSTVFFSHQYWGASLCQRGNFKAAAMHLIECGKVEGTPGLRLIIPPVFLAQSMIEQGENQVAVAFLVELKRWWVCGAPLGEAVCKERKRLVNKWIGQAQRGRVPTGYPWYPKRVSP